MQIEFAEPAPALNGLISLYYRITSAASKMEEIDRADIGHLRFVLKGEGYMEFHDGSRGESGPAILTGPGSAAARIRLTGPVDVVGCSILPAAWGGHIFNAEADDHADRLCDARPLLGAHFDDVPEILAQTTTLEEAKLSLDKAFINITSPPVQKTIDGIEEMRAWLASGPDPQVSDLMQGDSARTRRFNRIANRYYGGSAKAMARKVRAMKAAQAIMMNGGDICDEALEPFYDQSHMVREIRHFTGRSPGKLVSPDEMLLQMLLDLPYFRELESSHEKEPPPPIVSDT